MRYVNTSRCHRDRRVQAERSNNGYPIMVFARSAVSLCAIVLVIACGSDSNATTEPTPTPDPNIVGSTGGTVSAAGGAASLTVPPGALTSDVKITVAAAADPASDSRTVSGSTFQFGPAGTKFAQPVTLTLKYDKTKLPAGAAQSELRLAQLNTDGLWSPVTDAFVLDSVTGQVKVAVTELGTSTVAGLQGSSGDASGPFDGRASSAFSFHPIWTAYFPPSNPCEPVTLGGLSSYSGQLVSADCVQAGNNSRRTDFFTVTTAVQSLLAINVAGNITGPFGLQAKGLAAYSSASVGSTLNTVVPAGTWMIFLTGADSTVRGNYTISATSTPFAPRNACESLNIISGQSIAGRVESNPNSGDCSAVIPQSEPNAAHRGQTTYYDFYRVRLFAGKTYTVNVTSDGTGNPCMAVWLGNTVVVPWVQNGVVTRTATITPTSDLYYGLEVESCSSSASTWSPAPLVNYTISINP